ncbi:hypothetical protein [Azospirillum doebereinerae]
MDGAAQKILRQPSRSGPASAKIPCILSEDFKYREHVFPVFRAASSINA